MRQTVAADRMTFNHKRIGRTFLLVLAVCLLPVSPGCKSAKNTAQPTVLTQQIDLQGHRGARGLLPENSIPSFLLAADLGVDTIELDVVVSKDSQVVVSHEPWFSSEICSHPDGTAVTEDEQHGLNIFAMTYAEIGRFDCGRRGNPRFPAQKATPVKKPLLAEAVSALERHASQTGRKPVLYNVEIKSKPEGDNLYHPAPPAFARLVHEVLSSADVLARTTIQSFDPRALEAVRNVDTMVSVALLVENELGLAENLAGLTFLPNIYSPNYRLVDARLVSDVRQRGVTLVPWTVNDEKAMTELLGLGVDGLITDYPDRGRRVVDAYRESVVQ